jgi:hypothetical protein
LEECFALVGGLEAEYPYALPSTFKGELYFSREEVFLRAMLAEALDGVYDAFFNKLYDHGWDDKFSDSEDANGNSNSLKEDGSDDDGDGDDSSPAKRLLSLMEGLDSEAAPQGDSNGETDQSEIVYTPRDFMKDKRDIPDKMAVAHRYRRFMTTGRGAWALRLLM